LQFVSIVQGCMKPIFDSCVEWARPFRQLMTSFFSLWFHVDRII
jgi:hypothetical protein